MKASEIQTGMIGLVHHPDTKTLDGLAEEVIAELTKGHDFYHVMWFVRLPDGTIQVREMVQPEYRIITLDQRLADLDGELCIGTMPWVVAGQPELLMRFFADFDAHPEWHPYGTESLLPTGISSDFGIQIDPLKEQPVCSLLIERGVLSIEQGDIDRMWTPNDCAAHCVRIEPFEP